VEADNILGMVGYRPNKSITEELQVHYCYATEGPMKLAAAMMAASGGGGDCLSQVAPGAQTLVNPEPGFFILGMKSYGRGSGFLLRLGHEQVQHIMELIIPPPVQTEMIDTKVQKPQPIGEADEPRSQQADKSEDLRRNLQSRGHRDSED